MQLEDPAKMRMAEVRYDTHVIHGWKAGSGFEDGSYYGPLLLGKKHGKGYVYWPNKDKLSGHWVDDVLEGPVPHIFSRGGMFQGDYKAGKRHGWGITILPDNTREEAMWENDEVVGEIKIKTPGGWVALKDPKTRQTRAW